MEGNRFQLLPAAIRRKVGAVLLLVALVGTTIFAASVLSSVKNPVLQPTAVPSAKTSPLEYGRLTIDVLLGIRQIKFSPLDLPTNFKPIPFESISITRTDSHEFYLLVHTNFTGLASLQLPVSNSYRLTVNDTRFKVVVPFSVQKDQQTNVVIKANRIAYRATFQESEDALSSGWVTPISKIFLTVQSAQPLPSDAGVLYLETERATGIARTPLNMTADRAISLTPLRLVSEETRQDQLQLQVSPSQPVAAAGLTRFFVVTFAPSFTITFGTNLT